jgi:hypothetical protein
MSKTQVTMTVSLSRAHHIAKRILALAQGLRAEALSLASPEEFRLPLGKQYLEQLESRGLRAMQTLEKMNKAYEVLASVRAAIGLANTQFVVGSEPPGSATADASRGTSISEALARAEVLREKLSTLNSILQANDRGSLVELEDAKALSASFDASKNPNSFGAVRVVSQDSLLALKDSRSAIQKELYAVTDWVAEKNASLHVVLTLPKELADQVLGS